MKVEDAKKPLRFHIEKRHVAVAKCKDPRHCVIAEALRDAVGELFDDILIGPTITKVIQGQKTRRYKTPSNLARAIRKFDETKTWDLTAGEYCLDVPTGRYALGGGRLALMGEYPKAEPKVKQEKGLRKFTGRKAPTRHVPRVKAG